MNELLNRLNRLLIENGPISGFSFADDAVIFAEFLQDIQGDLNK